MKANNAYPCSYCSISKYKICTIWQRPNIDSSNGDTAIYNHAYSIYIRN